MLCTQHIPRISDMNLRYISIGAVPVWDTYDGSEQLEGVTT